MPDTGAAGNPDHMHPHFCREAILDEMREALLVLEPIRNGRGECVDVACVFSNIAFTSLSCRPREQLIGKTLREIRTEREFAWLDRCEKAVRSCLRDTFSMYDLYLNRWLEIRIVPFQDDTFLLVTDDVTRKDDFQVESSTEYSVLRTLTKMTKMTEDFLFTLDTGGHFTGVFGKWITANGFTTDHFIGRSVAEVLGEDAGVRFESALMQAVMNGYTEYEWAFRSKDRKEPTVLQVLITPIEQIGVNHGMIGIGRDITKLVHKQNELNRALQEKTVLLQEVLHRVNNNLQLIVSLIELQLAELQRAEPQRPEYASPSIEDQFFLLRSRICAMAAVHEALAAGSFNDRIKLQDLVVKLTYIIDEGKKFFPSIDIETLSVDADIILPVEVALPVAVILHEYILRLARTFAAADKTVKITLKGSFFGENACDLTVRHIREDGSVSRDDLSETIIQGLASQIKGSIAERVEAEREWNLRFPVNGAGHPQLPSIE